MNSQECKFNGMACGRATTSVLHPSPLQFALALWVVGEHLAGKGRRI